MRLRVLSGGVPVGWLEPARVDTGMGVVHGRFHPLPAYESIARVFRRRAEEMPEQGPEDGESVRRYHAALGALALSLERADGAPLDTGWIEVYDFSTATAAEELEAAAQVAGPFEIA